MFELVCDVLTRLSARLGADADADYAVSDPLAGASAAWIGPGPSPTALGPLTRRAS